jgi:hypothetical protein
VKGFRPWSPPHHFGHRRGVTGNGHRRPGPIGWRCPLPSRPIRAHSGVESPTKMKAPNRRSENASQDRPHAFVHLSTGPLSIVRQTIATIEGAVAAGRWTTWLPAERILCETLQVSRSTLRRALVQMQRAGHIRPEHGRGNRILKRAASRSHRCRSSDGAVFRAYSEVPLPLNLADQIDDLHAVLRERGCQLHISTDERAVRLVW